MNHHGVLAFIHQSAHFTDPPGFAVIHQAVGSLAHFIDRPHLAQLLFPLFQLDESRPTQIRLIRVFCGEQVFQRFAFPFDVISILERGSR